MISPFLPGNLVAAYLRDSGGDDQDLSTDRQEAEIRAWCEQNQLTLSQVFRDIHRPGSSTVGRTGFEAMISLFHQKPAPSEAGVIVWRYSRFSRDFNDAQFYKSDLRRRGFILHSMKDDIPAGLDGQLFEAIMSWKDARFLKDLGEDARSGLQYVFRSSGAMPGVPPVGFKQEPIDVKAKDGSVRHDHRWVPDPEKWELCKIAWQMRASGSTYLEIMQKTHLYRSVNCWTGFFSNKIYIGELHFGDEMIKIEQMVAEHTWDAVQTLRQNHIRRVCPPAGSIDHPRRLRSTYLLSGLLFCGKCGSPMNGNVIYAKNGRSWHYYTCSRKTRRRDCTARNIPRDFLETKIIDECAEKVLQNARVKELAKSTLPDDQEVLQKKSNELQGLLSGIQRKIGRLVDTIADKGHSTAILERLTQLEAEESRVKSELELSRQYLKSLDKMDEVQIDLIVANLSSALKTGEPDLQRKALRSFILKITVEREKNKIVGLIEFLIPPETIDYKKCPQGVPLYIHNFTFQIPPFQHHHKILPLDNRATSCYNIDRNKEIKMEIKNMLVSNGYIGAMGIDYKTPTQDDLEKSIVGAMEIEGKTREEIIAILESGKPLRWCKSVNYSYDHSYGKIGTIQTPKPVEMVKCNCGHTVAKNLVMSASMGISCPDCYDRMSE